MSSLSMKRALWRLLLSSSLCWNDSSSLVLRPVTAFCSSCVLQAFIRVVEWICIRSEGFGSCSSQPVDQIFSIRVLLGQLHCLNKITTAIPPASSGGQARSPAMHLGYLTLKSLRTSSRKNIVDPVVSDHRRSAAHQVMNRDNRKCRSFLNREPPAAKIVFNEGPYINKLVTLRIND